VHAGAGGLGPELREHEAECRQTLIEALCGAQAVVERGGDAVDAVIAAVRVLEDFEYFNAGTGAALCSDGTVQLSAALMRGSDRAAGAVAGVRTIRNPIVAAQAVMQSHQVLMIGADAERVATAAGVEAQSPHAFVRDHMRARLAAHAHAHDRGTVGAVCLDRSGGLAAATSTGGITGQPPGRVGDTPLIGAGTWANDRVAVSCTGEGEAFIRSGTTRYVSMLVEAGAGLAEATAAALEDVAALGGDGGLIALDAGGRVAMPFTTESMPRGLWRAGADPTAWVAERDPVG
jgi:beta-aspartyl-peptidase (threonine type)